MRDNPSNVPSGNSVRPIAAIGASLVVLLAVVVGAMALQGAPPPDRILVSVEPDDSLVDAADVFPPSDLPRSSPVRQAVEAARRGDGTATLAGTSADLEIVEWSHRIGARTVYVRAGDTQYRVDIVESSPDSKTTDAPSGT